MLEITKDNYKDITFDGIIIGVDKRNTFQFCFVFECAYYSKGKHGYPKQGRKPDNSSFYSAFYNDTYLPNGLMFNATSRFTLEDKFRFEACDYYKFDDMAEFCTWYLQQYDYEVWATAGDSRAKIMDIEPDTEEIEVDTEEIEPEKEEVEHVCNCHKKQKRYEKLKDVQKYVQMMMNIHYHQYIKLFRPDCTPAHQIQARVEADKLRSELIKWLQEEV